MRFMGYVLRDSLNDESVLDHVRVCSERLEPLTGWAGVAFAFEGDEQAAGVLATRFCRALKPQGWYLDFSSEHGTLFVVYPDRFFRLVKDDQRGRAEAISHGLTLGIPAFQLDFAWSSMPLDEKLAADERFNELQHALVGLLEAIEVLGDAYRLRFPPGGDTVAMLEELNRQLAARGMFAATRSDVLPGPQGGANHVVLEGPEAEFLTALLRDAVKRLRGVEL